MTIQRDGDTFEVECNTCGETTEEGFASMREAIQWVQGGSWIAYTEDDGVTFEHKCSGCIGGEGRLERARRLFGG